MGSKEQHQTLKTKKIITIAKYFIIFSIALSILNIGLLIALIVIGSVTIQRVSSDVNNLLGGNSLGSLNINQLIERPFKGMLQSDEIKSKLNDLISNSILPIKDSINQMITSLGNFPSPNVIIHQIENYMFTQAQNFLPIIENSLNRKFSNMENQINTRNNDLVELKLLLVQLISSRLNKSHINAKPNSRELLNFVSESNINCTNECGDLSFCSSLSSCASAAMENSINKIDICSPIVQRILCECGW